ncbi:hypothetical protein [Ureibacillus thermophilus]|uniref:Uncharacterized protein n=1 Tax=Ureibacillus thermophilus TaxID=367743 RepID=A0A4P6UU09_9BACL|nr:hypothetical protein [Ureibacillus thermophilus]QBK26723.1 hypothetical protein DKZ56_13220 [Ureibacillus thermophilus]
METLSIYHKRKILKGRTKCELEKEIERHKQYGYVEVSETKYFESDSKPYQILVEKRWLAKENRNESTKVV